MNPQQSYPAPNGPAPKKATRPWVWLGVIGLVVVALWGGCALVVGSSDGPAGKTAPQTATATPRTLSESARKRLAMKECQASLGMPDNAVFSTEGQVALVMTDGSNKVIVGGNVTSSGVRSRYRCEVVVNDDFTTRVLVSTLR